MTTQPNPFPFLVTARKPTAVALGVLALVFTVCAILWGLRGVSAYKAEADKVAEGKDVKSKPFGDPELDITKDKDKEKDAAAKPFSADYMPAAVWAGLMAFTCLGAFGWLATREADAADPAAGSRLEVLTFGATAGLLTATLGFVWGVSWWESLTRWVNNGEKAEAKWVFVAVSVFFAGLTLMFFSTQLGRPAQRDNVLLRRLMHGFNAVFHGILVLILLVGVNVFFFLKVPATFVANDAAFTELTPESKTFLRSLDQPVHAYLIMPERFPAEIAGLPYDNLYADTRGLLGQAEDQSQHFKATFLSPSLDKAKINALYDQLDLKDRDQTGILLAVGEDRAATTFIRAEELLEIIPSDTRPVSYQVVYQGENRLLSELAYMTDSRAKMAVYFTQDHGELAVDAGGGQPDRSLSGVVNYLKARKIRAEALKLDEAKPKIPDDAAVVVIAGPRQTITPTSSLMKALPEYLKPTSQGTKPGKLMVFLPAFRGLDGKVAPTGLEELLAEVGLQLESARLVTRPGILPAVQGKNIPPDYLVAEGYETRHPLSPSFDNQWLLKDCRVVRASAQPNPALKLTRLMGTPRGFPTWQETDFTASPAATFEAMRADPNGPLPLQKKLSQQPQVFAFAVSAVAPGGDTGGKPPPEQPRMLVFASDTVLADRSAFDLGSPEFRHQLAAGGVDWLREREASIGIKPRAVNLFKMPPIEMDSKLTLLAMMTIGLAGLGVGVWYSRRR